MEKFLKFKQPVDIKDLHKVLRDPRIILLRESQTTNTIQVQVLDNISEKEIKQAFRPYQVIKVYNEFPYPLKYSKLPFVSVSSIGNIIKKIF